MSAGPRDALTELLIRLADGDRSAFDPVYEAVAPKVDAVCARLLGPGPDAEDAAQQALLHLFERIDRFDPDRGAALPWILGIAAWEARTVRQRRNRRREDPEDPASPAVAPTPGDPDRWDELDRVLAELRPVERPIVLAALGHAERPPIAPATFRKRLQRTLDRLRAVLGREP